MRKRSGCVLLLCAAAYGGSINFESPLPGGLSPNGSFIEGSPVDATAQVTNQFESLGAIFTTADGASYAALIALGAGHATSGTNGIGAVNASGNLEYALDIDIFLVVPGTLSPAVTDQISIRGDEIPIPGNVIFTAYDVDGNLIASGIQPDSAGGTYQLTAPGIHEFRLHSESGTVAYDDLVFDTPVAPDGASTPEPASYGFTLLGLGAVGLVRSRRSFSRFFSRF